MQKELIGEKVVQACVIRFLGTEKLDDGLVRYNYAYRDVLHKGEGIIDNIYDSKTHTFWGADVVEFAETESKNHFPIAKMAINAIDCGRSRKKIGAIDTVFVKKLG